MDKKGKRRKEEKKKRKADRVREKERGRKEKGDLSGVLMVESRRSES